VGKRAARAPGTADPTPSLIGWCPVVRSMMLSRRCAKPAIFRGWYHVPSPSGPRCRSNPLIALTAGRKWATERQVQNGRNAAHRQLLVVKGIMSGSRRFAWQSCHRPPCSLPPPRSVSDEDDRPTPLRPREPRGPGRPRRSEEPARPRSKAGLTTSRGPRVERTRESQRDRLGYFVATTYRSVPRTRAMLPSSFSRGMTIRPLKSTRPSKF